MIRNATVRRVVIPAVAVAVALALAGCSDGDTAAPTTAPVIQLGGPGETSRVLYAEEVAELTAATSAPPLPADVEFITAMIHHHQQALDMTALVADRAGGAEVPLLAERMAISQNDEIAILENWLENGGHPVPTHEDGHLHGGPMLGMLTDEQFAALEAASGSDFDVAFLTSMIQHHEGAVAMVEELFAAGGGQDPTVFRLASDMSLDQSVEIARMKTLLVELTS